MFNLNSYLYSTTGNISTPINNFNYELKSFNMYYYIPYIFFIIIVILILLMAIIKIKFRFWSIQPVFHIYDIGYMFFPPGIINHELPNENKYCNFKNIETITNDKLSDLKKEKLVNFIKLNYLRNDENSFIPKKQNIFPYFTGYNIVPIFSFYTETTNVSSLKEGNIIEDKKVIGVMTTRPINITINDSRESNVKIIAYYVDYLCVDKIYRNKGIAPQIIQTHHYNQRRINPKIHISLFKREGSLTGIVPLCVYSTYGFSVEKWGKPKEISAIYNLFEITDQNAHLLIDFIKINSSLFDITIITDIPNLIELIKTKNIFIFVLFTDNQVKSAYFYRKTCTFIKKNMEILTCFASINDKSNDYSIFIQGFRCSFWETANKNYFGFAAIENISHNDLIINHLLIKNHPVIISPTAYFFYNFAYHTFKPEKVLFIN
jgi:hypothetical protein